MCMYNNLNIDSIEYYLIYNMHTYYNKYGKWSVTVINNNCSVLVVLK